jgi:DNA-binding transcriptional regulator YhcF (GntR family)
MTAQNLGRDPNFNKRQHIVHELRRAMTTGQLRPRDKAPTEQQLVEQFGYSRTTVRSALAELRHLGLMVVDRPRGTFIADWVRTTQVDFDDDGEWMARMPTPTEIMNLGLLKEGEPVIEVFFPDGRVEVHGSRGRIFRFRRRPPADQ